MAIRKIARMGHPILRQIAQPIDDATAPQWHGLAQDLFDTCDDIGGNGIAAPQIYESVRMFVYRVREEMIPQGVAMAPIPWTVCINPQVQPLGVKTKLYWERCLSLPGLYGQAERAVKIRFTWSDLQGASHSIIARGFQARLIQHEYDHLDGILYPMRMVDAGTLGYVSELGPEHYPSLPRDDEDFVDPEPG